MSFDWTEYLVLALELQGAAMGTTIEEARLRSAISRAYYAAYCKARNYRRDVDGDPNIPKDGRAHIYIRNKFAQSSDMVRRSIGANLDRLRSGRRKADYDDTVRGLPAMAKSAARLAQKVLSGLARL